MMSCAGESRKAWKPSIAGGWGGTLAPRAATNASSAQSWCAVSGRSHHGGGGVGAPSTTLVRPMPRLHHSWPDPPHHPRRNERGSSRTLRRRRGFGGVRACGRHGARHAGRPRPVVRAVCVPSHRRSTACAAPGAAAVTLRNRTRFSAWSLGQVERTRNKAHRTGPPAQVIPCRRRIRKRRRYSPCSGALGITDPVSIRPVCGCDGRDFVVRQPLHWRHGRSCPHKVSSIIVTNADTVAQRKRGS